MPTRVRRLRLENTNEALLLESESKFVVTKQAGVKSKIQTDDHNQGQTIQEGEAK